MPTFDFRCRDCEKVAEKVVHSPNLQISCEFCGSVNMERLYTMGHFGIRTGYPLWVDRVDDHQKRQVYKGKEPTIPAAKSVL